MTEAVQIRSEQDPWQLPPLILHPFDQGAGTATILDSLKLSLYLAGIGEANLEKERMLRARYLEFRMLCLIGKDAMRWIKQCVDFSTRDQELAGAGFYEQHFADLLVNRTPRRVAARFETWGVADFRRLLGRAVGLAAVFPNPPAHGVVSVEFLEDYYSYADHLFAGFLAIKPFAPLSPGRFEFLLFTSDEYMKTLDCHLDEPA